MLPAAQRHLNSKELEQALECAERAGVIGERFAERDLIAFARNLQGRALLALGRVEQGLAMLDESMVAVISGELSPIVTGIVYCSSIVSCHRVFALERVREWTVALSTWCAAHPQLGMFTGTSSVTPRAARTICRRKFIACEVSSIWPRVHIARPADADSNRSRVSRCCASRKAMWMRPQVPVVA